MRRRLAVTAAVLAALGGEWLGHSLNYFRMAGVTGLRAGLSGGIHAYMVPLGCSLLAGAAAGAATWVRAWLGLSRRLDRSAAALARIRRGERPPGGAPPAGGASRQSPRAPSSAARVIALATALAIVQVALYVIQENLERAVDGLPSTGLSPLLDGYGAAAWIQAAIGLLLAASLVGALRLLRSKRATVERSERIVRALWGRATRATSSPPPPQAHVTPAQLLFRDASWCRPPPVLAASEQRCRARESRERHLIHGRTNA